MNGEEGRKVDGMKRLVVAVVVIHDPLHDIRQAPWPIALAANRADHRPERPHWTGIGR